MAATVALLALQQPLRHSREATFTIWIPTLCIQVAQSLSIITACAPNLVTLFGSLASGMLRVDEIRRQHGSFAGVSAGTADKFTGRIASKPAVQGLRSFFGRGHATRRSSELHMSTLRSPVVGEGVGRNAGGDVESTSSRANIITR